MDECWKNFLIILGKISEQIPGGILDSISSEIHRLSRGLRGIHRRFKMLQGVSGRYQRDYRLYRFSDEYH